MEYYIWKNELYHFGVKGMKWGVRKYQTKSGKLTKEGYEKYYTNGRINKAGKKARDKARKNQALGRRNLGSSVGGAVAGSLFAYNLGGKYTNQFIHQMGNIKITKMRHAGKSLGKRKAVAAATIGAMGAMTLLEFSSVIKAAYVGGRYNFDRSYKARTDAAANLKGYAKTQREYESRSKSKKK